MSVRLGRFMELNFVPPTTQFAYWKGFGTCDALLCVSHILQSALDSGQEAKVVQIDFSAAFDGVNHLGILYKLCSLGIVGSVLSILTQFLSNRSQQVRLDGCRSKLVEVVAGVPQGRVLGPLLFLLYTSELFSILKNKLIGYAEDSTFDLWGMKLNASKTKTILVSRSRTMHLQSPPTIGCTGGV